MEKMVFTDCKIRNLSDLEIDLFGEEVIVIYSGDETDIRAIETYVPALQDTVVLDFYYLPESTQEMIEEKLAEKITEIIRDGGFGASEDEWTPDDAA